MEIQNGFIYSQQLTLLRDRESISREVVGYRRVNTHVHYINKNLACSIIKKHHYSKTVFNNVLEHFGFYIDNQLAGILQFGYMLNHKSCSKLITTTKGINDYRELNRMFLYDHAPSNSASRAISLCFKILKAKGVKWVQSFADERCKKNGLVYQACNFKYYGFHYTDFYTYKNRTYHNIMFTHGRDVKPLEKRFNLSIEEIKKDAKKDRFKQFRYIYFIDKKQQPFCSLSEQPYPKHYK